MRMIGTAKASRHRLVCLRSTHEYTKSSQERNTPTERSVLILARKLRKTKEACRNSLSIDKSADRSCRGGNHPFRNLRVSVIWTVNHSTFFGYLFIETCRKDVRRGLLNLVELVMCHKERYFRLSPLHTIGQP